MEEGAQIYFARLYTLLCDENSRQVVVQDWFPSNYKSNEVTDKKANEATKNRRTQFYWKTRKNYRLLRNDNSDVEGLEKLEEVDKITAEEDEGQEFIPFLAF